MHKRYKTALITGAASGIGYSILKKLSNYKFKIYALDKNKIKLKKVCNETGAYPINLDIANTDALYSKLSKLNIDILVSNAGIANGIEGLLKSSKNDILKSTKVNYESILHIIKILVPKMVKKRNGHIFLIGSIAGLYPTDSAIYSSQKTAIHKIAQSLRIELSGSRVKLTEISPGRTKTSFGNNVFSTSKMKKKFMSGFQVLDPDDISNALLFALNTKWKTNVSLIEISPTEQSPGGIPIIPVKDPIL
jgi:3-hydroxy acid dehydrogenase/malonic semialdehyde reductase|tara:strand:- start:26 stop:772 length:747 start_codon:yes stop_codon:yes gene_type:complete